MVNIQIFILIYTKFDESIYLKKILISKIKWNLYFYYQEDKGVAFEGERNLLEYKLVKETINNQIIDDTSYLEVSK